MAKSLKQNNLFGRNSLLAIAFATSVAAFGCTTDRTLGDGNLNDYSGVRTAPTAGNTTGSETAPVPQPMTSSYNRPEPLPPVSRSMKKLSADEASLIMADQRPAVRVLGPVNPGLTGSSYYSAGLLTGRWRDPAKNLYPQQAATSGAAGNARGIVGDDAEVDGAVLGVVDPNATTSPSTSGAVTPVFPSATGAAASTISANAVVPTSVTPTNAAAGVTPGAFAAGPGSQAFAVTNSGRTIGTTMPSAQQSGTSLRVVNGANGVTVTNVTPASSSRVSTPAQSGNAMRSTTGRSATTAGQATGQMTTGQSTPNP
jgi:hypothetical protein